MDLVAKFRVSQLAGALLLALTACSEGRSLLVRLQAGDGLPSGLTAIELEVRQDDRTIARSRFPFDGGFPQTVALHSAGETEGSVRVLADGFLGEAKAASGETVGELGRREAPPAVELVLRPLCSPSTCPLGCCEASGRCLTPGDTPAACGRQGKGCERCQGAQACDQGWCRDPGCAGCIGSDGGCLAGGNPEACGRGGVSCQTCAGACVDGNCPAGGCGPSTCGSGCCAVGSCVLVPAQSNTRCGSGGAGCVSCPAELVCSAGACQGGCSAANCPGCCNGSTCVPYASQAAASCGAAGAQCASCPDGGSCLGGACCVPKSCAALMVNCGTIPDDGCGSALDCGTCLNGSTCSQHGGPNLCDSAVVSTKIHMYEPSNPNGSTWTPFAPVVVSNNEFLLDNRSGSSSLNGEGLVVFPSLADQVGLYFGIGFTSTGGDVRLLLSVDGQRSWKTWTGTAWASANFDTACTSGYSERLNGTNHPGSQELFELLRGTSQLAVLVCLIAPPNGTASLGTARRAVGSKLGWSFSAPPVRAGQPITATLLVPALLRLGADGGQLTSGDSLLWGDGASEQSLIYSGPSTQFSHTYLDAGSRVVRWYFDGAEAVELKIIVGP